MNYCEHHLGDYAKRAFAFSMLEHGAYSTLRDRYFVTEAPIPAADVYRLACARTKEERAAVDVVLREFFRLDGDVWVCDSFADGLAKAHNKINTAKANGKLGGRPKQTQSEPTNNPVGLSRDTQQKALHTPDTNTEAELPKEKRAAKPPRPDDVDPQVWDDWCQLRKGRRAAVSVTAVQGARDEAAKAGMTLEAFLRVWCRRGSTGLEAAWLKADERQPSNVATFAEREAAAKRAQGQAWMGSAMPSKPSLTAINTEDDHAPRIALG